MRRICLGGLSLLIVGVVLLAPSAGSREEAPKRKPYGIEKRVPWTTSKVVGSPEPPPPYRLEKVFNNLTFNEPLELSRIPGGNRWVIAERKGKLVRLK